MTINRKSQPARPHKALFFCSHQDQKNDNHTKIPKAFKDSGWEVTVQPHDHLKVKDMDLLAGIHQLSQFDLIWPVGFGEKSTFLDRLQLLSACPEGKLITSLHSWLLFHGKAAWLKYCPLSVISTDADELIGFMKTHTGEWVLKPNAGSYARNISFIKNDQTGIDKIRTACADRKEFYILQRFLPEIKSGETRCICVDGRIIGSYLKLPVHNFLANVSQEAKIEKTIISKAQAPILERIKKELIKHDIGFAAIDLVGDTLMEVNIANPGGLTSLETLYSRDFSKDLVSIINKRFEN